MPNPNVQPPPRSTPNTMRGEPPRGDADISREDQDLSRAARDQSMDRRDAHGSDAAFGTSFLDHDTDQAWQRWREIQANFVDEPREAVGEAHHLVSELMDGIVRRFDSERQDLEGRWSSGENVSTEELRRCLQRYRDFFGRLLANLGEKHS